MNIVFVTGVEIGRDCLELLLEGGLKIRGLVCLDRSKAKQTSGFVDFESLCRQSGIERMEASDINSPETVSRVRSFEPDVLLVCGWQRLLKKDILSVSRWGTIGVHSSLLPKYRGRAPVNWAILRGETETGVTVFKMDEGADTGPILGQKAFSIDPLDTCSDIYRKSARATAEIFLEILPEIEKGTLKARENPSAGYPCMPKRTPEDGVIDWRLDAVAIHNRVRALAHPYPGAFTEIGGRRLLIWKAIPLHPGLGLKLAPGERRIWEGTGVIFGCGGGANLLALSVQWEGEGEARADLVLRGKDFRMNFENPG